MVGRTEGVQEGSRVGIMVGCMDVDGGKERLGESDGT